MQLVECVPNISEGRDRSVIDAVTAEIEKVAGCTLLDVDPGEATNRTVITFVGPPSTIVDAAVRLAAKAAELIDMRNHSGAHARNGATDVCPFVPVAGVTMEDCVEIAKQTAERIGTELGIPAYLYEHAASKPEWRNLANVRKGEYEALKDKLGKPEWKPDFGPDKWNDNVAKTGATQVGAREFLIAYNINLDTKNTKVAREIGKIIREQGGAIVRDENNKKKRGEDGKFVRTEKGLFEHCKATGWFIEEYGVAQVTMNLTNYHITPPHVVFDKVCELAMERGARVTGSEIVGLIPLEAMKMAGTYYLIKQKQSWGIPETDIIDQAARSMGFSDVAPFRAEEKIIEQMVMEKRPLIEMSSKEFVDELSRDSAAPGGGSVAALCGSLAAGLGAMVANLTIGKKGYKKVQQEMRALAAEGQELKDFFLNAVDDDTFAFNRVMDGFGMPKGTPEEKKAREDAIETASQEATMVPLSVLEKTPAVLEIAHKVAERGNQNSLSDAGVASLAATTAACGAYYNVLINLGGLTDKEFVNKTREKADQIWKQVEGKAAEIHKEVLEKLRS